MAKVHIRELRIRAGSEGPGPDPYMWEEFIVRQKIGRQREHTITFRMGALGYHKLFVDGREVKCPKYTNEVDKLKVLQLRFSGLTGIRLGEFEKFYYRIHGPKIRCPKCGGKNLPWSAGYVGEAMQWCTSCGICIYCEPVTDAMIA